MKGYIDNLERLEHPVTLGLGLHEQTLPKNNALDLHAIRAGHWKRNFPQYLAELLKKKKSAASGVGGSSIFVIELHTILNRSWIYDTYYGTYICNTTQGLRARRKLKPRDLNLYVGNGHREAVEDDLEIDEPQSDIVPIHRSTRTRHALDRICLYLDAKEHELRDLGIPTTSDKFLLPVYIPTASEDMMSLPRQSNATAEEDCTANEYKGTPTEPHYTPTPEAPQPSQHEPSSSSPPPVNTESFPIVIHTNNLTLRQYTRRARIAQSLALSIVADEPASPLGDDSQGEETVAKKGSDDTEELVNVLTSLDAAKILTSGGVQFSVSLAAEVATVSIPPVGEIPTVSVPTVSGVVPTVSPIFTTVTVATPYSRRKGKEKMV
nr:hypothetical protein [Tanacetum cinerariifolium]